jgi:TetR/AcrR family transcriptional repressor of lmrAB and yxaGH operons
MRPESEAKTRSRMLRTTARLLQRQGYHATGLRQILTESGAPRGSLYFHFPGGKEELAVEAVRAANGRTARAIEMILSGSEDPAAAISGFVRAFAEILRQSDWAEGCPIATVTLEAAATSEPIRAACADSYADWQRLIRAYLERTGVSTERAETLALLVLAAAEGGLILSRAQRDIAPLEQIAEELAGILRAAQAADRRSPIADRE